MKKVLFRLTSIALFFGAIVCSCQRPDIDDPDNKKVATVKQADLIAAVKAMYSEWEETTEIPTSLEVAGANLTQGQYQYAMFSLLPAMVSGDKSDIDIIEVKDATHPERDSYDKTEIAVKNGPANGDETEDLVNICNRIVAAAKQNAIIPNQTLFTRSGNAIAFSTNRATVCVARAIAGDLPENIETSYLSAASTLKGFAKQLVKYLDIWEETVGNVSADGGHCSDNGNAWEDVHFIPIPHSGGAYTGDQYDDKYKPYYEVEIAGTTYDAAQCWVVAAKGIIDLITKEGSSTLISDRNVPVHTLGNGAKFSESIPAVEDWAQWGGYPWYEYGDDIGVINFSAGNPCNAGVLYRLLPWYLVRSSQLGNIGNYNAFGEGYIVHENYTGEISAMRTFIIMCRFYKYLLDNDINENVYDAVKDIAIDYDLYGLEQPGVSVTTKSLAFDGEGGTLTVSIVPNENWTATTDADWLAISPAAGGITDNSFEVTAGENGNNPRTATISVKAGSTEEIIEVSQSANVSATIMDFARAYVGLLDIWNLTTGNFIFNDGYLVPATKDEALAKKEEASYLGVVDGHYIPEDTKITVGGVEFNTADVFELALRSYLLLRGYDGNDVSSVGAGKFASVTPSSMGSGIPSTHSYTWGTRAYNETGTTTAGGVTTGNGGHLMMGSDVTADGVPCQVKLDILDNFAMRAVNFDSGNPIANLCGYDGRLDGYYGCFSTQRALITYAFFFKYMLDNNLDDATGISADQIFRSELFGDEGGEQDVTINDFMNEYVKLIEIWEANTGCFTYTEGGVLQEATRAEAEAAAAGFGVIDGHYIPEDTKINVGGKVYGIADIWELAMRSYLLLRGYDGNNTTASLGGFPEATASIFTTIPETHEYYFGSGCYNELPGNNGHFVMDGVPCTVNVRLLDNFAQRALNYASGQAISNMCGYPRGEITNCIGSFSAIRGLVTYAFFFKYMLDNNLTDAKSIPADQLFRCELFGDEGATIADFAREYVKILDVWEANTGNFSFDDNGVLTPMSADDADYKDAHYIPEGTTISVVGKEYGIPDMCELALRSYLLLRGCDGNGATSFPAIETAATMSDKLTDAHHYDWAAAPYNEGPGNGGFLTLNGEHCKVKLDWLDNFSERALRWAYNNECFANLCGYNGGELSGYAGCGSTMRGMLTLAFFYKYMLENELADATGISADTIFRSELFGIE